MTDLIFLGTGGGRFTTIYQPRGTGGIYLKDKLNLHLDPGPGALVALKREHIDPTKTDAILVSHRHPDHFCETEMLIEAATKGGRDKRGYVAAPKPVLDSLSGYHKTLTNLRLAEVGKTIDLGDLKIKPTRCFHSTPTVGFLINTGNHEHELHYIPDTDFEDDLTVASRILILAVTRPLHARIKGHLSPEDCVKLIKNTKPELAIITHFGLKILRENPSYQADWIWKQTGIKTIAAYDCMRVRIGKEIEVI